MRKLIMWNLTSLDGFVEGPNRDISWLNDVWGPELEQFSIEQGKEIGALKKADWANTTLLTGDAAVEVAKLKRAEGKDIFAFGGADLSSHVMQLFDELRIGVAPLVLGSGSPLFKKQNEKAKLKLLGADQHRHPALRAAR